MTSEYTLYFSPGSCALIVNCLMEELGLQFDLKRVDVEAREHHGDESVSYTHLRAHETDS